MKVNKISESLYNTVGYEDSNKNKAPEKEVIVNITRDSIALALEVSERSGVPILFLSNPGEGKTTGVKTFGKVHKRHVEFLMGSQYSQEDILGFMTNTGKEYLEVKIPEWYYRIKEYTKWHWEIKDDSNFELGYVERKKLIDEKKLYLNYRKGQFTEEQLLDMDIPFDKIDIDQRISEIDKELEEKFVWSEPRDSILFLDELSAATPTVQAALLRLCHEKTLRGNNKLPKGCIVCAAGNFRKNLPSFMEIIAPELNRFCIINLLRGDKKSKLQDIGEELVSEATQDFYENTYHYPAYNNSFTFSSAMNKNFLSKYRKGLINIFNNYAGEDSPNGILDLRNTNFDGMFDGTDNMPEISNFISVRSISYFARVLRALCELKITPNYLNGIYKKFSIGMLGLGTNSWDSKIDDRELQLSNYQKELNYLVSDLLSEFNHPSKDTISLLDNNIPITTEVIEGSINDLVRKYLNKRATTGNKFSDLEPILQKIGVEFPDNPVLMVNSLNSKTLEQVLSWRADYEAIKLLADVINNSDEQYSNIYYSPLKTIINDYEFYYKSCLADMTIEKLKG